MVSDATMIPVPPSTEDERLERHRVAVRVPTEPVPPEERIARLRQALAIVLDLAPRGSEIERVAQQAYDWDTAVKFHVEKTGQTR